MNNKVVCIRCEHWTPDKESALNPKPACWGKACHGYFQGCTCPACWNRYANIRRELADLKELDHKAA